MTRIRFILFLAVTAASSTSLFAEGVTCSSEDGGRHHCDIGRDYSTVRMVHQRSGSRCEEGYSWGTDDRGIWVDHGCRADFDVDRSNYSRDGRSAENVTCSSEDGSRHYCRVAARYARVRMLRQRSGSRCEEGYSWGTDERGIWVDHGCRADFSVERRRDRDRVGYIEPNDPNRGSINNPNHGAEDRPQEKIINCSDAVRSCMLVRVQPLSTLSQKVKAGRLF
jgi:Protein of unknown function (DUF3011)